MKRRHDWPHGRRRLGSLIVPGLLLFASCAAHAAGPHFALATTATELFVFRDQGTWGAKSWSRLLGVNPGSAALAGVAADGSYVYVVDNSADGKLIVGRVADLLGTPTWVEVATVALQSADGSKKVKSPTRLAPDGRGGVYVIGGSQGANSYFAYVKPTAGDWALPIVSIGDLPGSVMADVAVGRLGTSAIIAHSKDTPTTTRASHASKVVEGDVSSTTDLSPLCLNARAVAVVQALGADGYAYVVNYNSDSTRTKGSVRAVDIATGMPRGTQGIELPDMIPEDVTTFAVGQDYYLGIVGHDAALQRAMVWKVPLSADDWTPLPGSAVSRELPITTGHQAAASSDGEVLWYVSETGAMGVLDTASWTAMAPPVANGWFLGEGIRLENVAEYPPSLIPEPSSLASLGGLIAAVVSIRRRRR